MIIRNMCPMCGNVTERDLDVTQAQLIAYDVGNELIQNVFPNLSAPERESIKTGYCEKCMQMLFGQC